MAHTFCTAYSLLKQGNLCHLNIPICCYHREIGEQIYIACGENDRAEYGKGLLKYLSERLTAEFRKGFTIRNLRNMRQFYLTYQKRHTLCTELSWSHYRILMRIDDKNRRNWYTEECAKSGWSVRQLERQINTLFYDRLLASKDIVKYTLPEDNKQVFAAKYITCIPSEEEFKRELKLSDFEKLNNREEN